MQRTYRLIGLWVLVVAMTIAARFGPEANAAPAKCQQCTCKMAKTWKFGFNYWGLRHLNDDGSTIPVDHMYQQGGQVPSSWSAMCDPGTRFSPGSEYGYQYNSGTPDCTYGGADYPLIACTGAGTAPTYIGNTVVQWICKQGG
jgi:hypothetical protein